MAWWFYVTSPLQCLFRFFRFLAPKKHEESRKRPLQNIRPTEEVDRPDREESETLCKDDKESYNEVGKDITKNISDLYDTNSQEERIIASSEEVEQNIQGSIVGLSEEHIQAHSSDDKIVNDNFNSSKERKSADVDDLSQERTTMSQDNFSQTSSHKELTEYLHLNEREEDYVARSAVGFGKLELISRMLTEQTTSEADEGNQTETQIAGFSSDSIENSEVVSVNPEDHNCPTNQTDNNFIAKPKTEIKVVGATMKKIVNTLKTEDTEIQNIQKQVLEENVNEIGTYDEQNVMQRIQRTDNRACEDGKTRSIDSKILINEMENYSTSLLEQVESPEKTRTEQLLENTVNYNAKCDQSLFIEMVVTKSTSSKQEGNEELLHSLILEFPANIAIKDDFKDTLFSNECVTTDLNSKNELTEPSLDVLAIDDANSKILIFENEANEKLIMHSTNKLSILNQDAPGLETESSITADESCHSDSCDSASTDSDSTFKFSDSEKEMDKQEKNFSHKDYVSDEFQNSQTNEKVMKLGNESMQTNSSAPETRADLSGYEMTDNSKEPFVGLNKEANLKEVHTYLTSSSINSLCKSEIKSAEPEESIAADSSHELLMLLNKTNQCDPASVTLEEPLLEFKTTITNSTNEPTTFDIENHTNALHHYDKEILYDNHVTTDNKNYEKGDKLESNSTCDSHDYDKDKAYEGSVINDNKNYKKDDISENNSPHDAHEYDKEKTDKLESNSTCDFQDYVIEIAYEGNATIDNKNYEKDDYLDSNVACDFHDYDEGKENEGSVTINNKNYEKDNKMKVNSACGVYDNGIEKTDESNVKIDNKNYKKDDISKSNPPHDAHDHDKEKTDKLKSNSTCVFQAYVNEIAYEGNATIDNKNYEKDDNLDSNIACDLHDYDEGKEIEGIVTINNKKYEKDNKIEVNSACGVYDNDIEKTDESNVKIDNKNYKKDDISESNPPHDAHDHDKEKTDKLESNSICEFQDYVNEIAYEGNATIDNKNYEKDDNLDCNIVCDLQDYDEGKEIEGSVTINNKNYEKDNKMEVNSACGVYDNDIEKTDESNVKIDNNNYKKDDISKSNPPHDAHGHDKEKTDKLESNSTCVFQDYVNEIAYDGNATIDNKNYEKDDNLDSNIACDLHDCDEGNGNEGIVAINNKKHEKDNKIEGNSACGICDDDIETTDESNVKIDSINYNLDSNLTNDFHDYDEEKDNECSVVINNKNYAEDHKLEINSSTINKNIKNDDKMEDNSTYDDYDKEKTYEGDLIIDNKKNEHEKLENSSTLDVQSNTKNTTDLEYNESEIKNSNDTIKILFCNLSSQIKEVVFDDSVTMNSGFESVNKQQEEKINDLVVNRPYTGLSDAKSKQKEKKYCVSTTSFSSRLIPIKYDSNHRHEFGKQESDWGENSEAGKSVTQVNVKNTNFDKVINETKIPDSAMKISSQENFASEQIINSVHLELSDQRSHLIRADEIKEHVDNKSILLDSTEKVNDEFLNSEHDMRENKMEILQAMNSIVEGVNKDINFNLPCESSNGTYGQNQQEEIVLSNNESSKITDSLEFLLSKCDIEDKQPSDHIYLNPVTEFLDLENEKMKESLYNLSEKDIILRNEMNEQSLMNSNCMQNLNISSSNRFHDSNVPAKDVMATNLMCEKEVEKSEDSSLVAILDSDSQLGSILGLDSNCEIVILDQNAQDLVEKDAESDKREDLIYENNSKGQEKNYWKINLELPSSLGCKSEKQDIENHLLASNENQKQTELKIKATELTLQAPLNPNESSILELEKPEPNDKKVKMDTDDFLTNDPQNEFSRSIMLEPTSEIYEQLDAISNTIVVKSCHDFRDEEEPMDYECLHEDSFDSHVTEEDLKPVEGVVIEEFLDKVEQFNSPENNTSLRRSNKLPSPVLETNSQDKRRGMMNLYYDEEEMEVDEIFIAKQTVTQLYDDVQEASISSENRAKRIGNVLFPSIDINKDSQEKPILLAEWEPFSEIKSKRLGFIRLSSNEELQTFDEFLLSDKKQIAMEKKVSFSKTGEIQRPINKTPPFDFANQKFFSTTTKNNVEKILEEPSTTEVLNIRTPSEEVTNESQMEEFKCSFSLEEPLTDTFTKETIMEVLPQNNDTERIKESVESAPATNINHEIVCNLNGKVPSFEIRHKTDEHLPMLTLSQITNKLQATDSVNSAPPITNEVREALNNKPVGGDLLFEPGNKPNVGAPLFSVAQKSDKEQNTESDASAPPIYEKHKVVNKEPIKRVPLLGLENKPNKGASLFTLPQKCDEEKDTDRNNSAYQTIVKHEVATKKPAVRLPLFGIGHKPDVGISMFTLPQQTSTNNDAKCLDSAPFISVEQESIRNIPFGGVALFGLGHKPVGGVSMFKLPQKNENDRDTLRLDSAPINDKEHKSVCKLPTGGVPLFELGHELDEEVPKFIAKKHYNSNETTPPFTGYNCPTSKKPIGGISLFGLGHKPFAPMLINEEKKIPVGGVKLFGGSELTAKLKGRREKLNEDHDHDTTPSPLMDNEPGYFPALNEAVSKYTSIETKCNNSSKKKPVGGVSLFDGNEFQEKLKARRGKLSAEDDNHLSHINENKIMKKQNVDDLHNTSTSDDKSVDNFFHRFDIISKTTIYGDEDIELSLEDFDKEKNILEHVNKSRPKGPLNRRPRQSHSRKEGKHR